MLAVLLLENLSHVKEILCRLVSWLMASCPAWLDRLRAGFKAIPSIRMSALHLARSRTAKLCFWRAAYALGSGVIFLFMPLPVVVRDVVKCLAFPLMYVSHLPAILRSRALQLSGGFLTGLGLALSARITQQLLKLTLHLNFVHVWRQMCLGPSQLEKCMSVDSEASASLSDASVLRRMLSIQTQASDPELSCKSSLYQQPSSLGTDCLRVCQPVMKRRRSVLRRRAWPGNARPDRPSLSRGPALQGWQRACRCCRHCRWVEPTPQTVAPDNSPPNSPHSVESW